MGNPSNPEATRAHFGGVMSKAAKDEKLCREEFESVLKEDGCYPLGRFVDGYQDTAVNRMWLMWREAWKRARALS